MCDVSYVRGAISTNNREMKNFFNDSTHIWLHFSIFHAFFQCCLLKKAIMCDWVEWIYEIIMQFFSVFRFHTQLRVLRLQVFHLHSHNNNFSCDVVRWKWKSEKKIAIESCGNAASFFTASLLPPIKLSHSHISYNWM